MTKNIKELTLLQYRRLADESPDEWEEDGKARWNPIDEAVILKIGGLGLPLKQMAAMLGTNGITVAQMERLYGQALHKTRAQLNANISKSIYEKAMSGDTAMLALWAKTQMGWSETTKRTLSLEEQESKTQAPTSFNRTFVGGKSKQLKEAVKEEALDDAVEQPVKEEIQQTKESWLDRLKHRDA